MTKTSPVLVNVLIFIFGFLLCSVPLFDPDLGWHIAIGRYVAYNWEVPQVEYWNTGSLGKPFVAYSWLFEVIVAQIDTFFGLTGVWLTQGFLGGALLFSVSTVCFRLSNHRGLSIVLLIFLILPVSSNISLRPQLISWILFCIVTYLSYKLSLNKKSCKKTKRKYSNFLSLLALFFVALLWANTNLTAVFGLMLCVSWILAGDLSKNLTKASLAALFFFSGTLCTPYFGKEWLVMFNKISHPQAHSYIKEFAPLSLVSWPVIVCLSLFFAVFLLNPKKFRFLFDFRLLLAVIFFVISLRIVKFVPFAVLSLTFLLSIMWKTKEVTGVPNNFFTNFLEKCIYRYDFRVFVLTAICSLPVLSLTVFKEIKYAGGIEGTYKKTKLIEKLTSTELGSSLVTHFDDGGNMLYWLTKKDGATRTTVTLDGRTNMNSEENTATFVVSLKTRKWDRYLSGRSEEYGVLRFSSMDEVESLCSEKKWCALEVDYPYCKGNSCSKFYRVLLVRRSLPRV